MVARIDEVKKSAFLLFFSGDHLKYKARRICDAFRVHIIDNCSESPVARLGLLHSVMTRLEDMQTVISKTVEHRDRVLKAAALNIKMWSIQVLKLKSIFHILNMLDLDITQKCLIAECWIPTADISQVKIALQRATELSGSNVPSIVNRLETHQRPPTHHKLNKFTRAFQGIVDAYGIASYREINPAPWTIITFPFIFAIMFGDSGHGTIMLLTAVAFIAFEKKIEAAKIRDEIFNTFYGGRYVILLMGLFAIYTGLIYNDIFSKSLDIFGSQWKNPYNTSTLRDCIMDEYRNNRTLTLELPPEYAFQSESGPYQFGVDPIWNLAVNRLNFLNSMKMKSSIIIGISQMTFGVILSLFNYIHSGSIVDILFVFVPQMLFLCLIFGYLCVQVVLKWIFFWVKRGTIFGKDYPGSHCAPSLLIGLINMFMSAIGMAHRNHDKEPAHDDQCYLQLWYPNQNIVETAFIATALLCIPVMLFVKPVYMWWKNRSGAPIASDHGHGNSDAKFNFGDVMVYQAIHTIEFALGCVSHTASYLRLWALSLAHAQLSDVLWSMLLDIALQRKLDFLATLPQYVYIPVLFAIFVVFSLLSVAILVLMEGLSAFLHALRLHWVEFQSKFYAGAGIPFEPFSFNQLIRVSQGYDP
ncbi:v-type ATPase subunit family domain-containing protein [Ditylenchus destructor]|uniref:V-type proton ATPase subunit a n=1 Tax=Ditylenchus destructor TaxID=166010 RepID=A0AAD4R422_9BILA|nr:v-type ATPase subunit family domain-containing protein [Ditylenchus destructor]